MRKKTRNSGRKDSITRKALESLVEELLHCGSRRTARAFDRYLTARFVEVTEGMEACPVCQRGDRPFSDRFRDCRVCRKKEMPLSALLEELSRRKTMTGKEMLQFWVWVNKSNRAKRFLDAIQKEEEAAEKLAAEKEAVVEKRAEEVGAEARR